jgi:hypothetical protein
MGNLLPESKYSYLVRLSPSYGIHMASKFLLSDIQAKALKPGTKRKRFKDGSGLFLVVSPSGAKWFEFRYRFCGRETSIGLGGYPETSLAEARIKAAAAREKLKDGENPSAERKAVKVSGMTFAEAAESYLKTRQDGGTKRVDETRRRLQRHVFPALGKMPLKSIATPQILEVVLAIKNKGREEMAKRCRTCCSQIFQHAMVRG